MYPYREVLCPVYRVSFIRGSTVCIYIHIILISVMFYGVLIIGVSLLSTAQEVGSCTIDNDAFDGVIDWTCTTNVAGVSIVCLVDEIQLEPCLCKPLLSLLLCFSIS